MEWSYGGMDIRVLDSSDLNEALELVWTVFSEFEAPDYSAEGIDTFRAFISYDCVSGMLADGSLRLWGCYIGEVLTGVIAARGPGHISLLFVSKEYQRRGIARALFAVLEEYCRASGADAITVNSSPYAVDIYHRLGFISTDKETVTNGIRFTPMRYAVD